MGTRLRLVIALGMLAVLALAAPAASAARPQQQSFVFFIYEGETLVAITAAAETFHGNSGVSSGTWTTLSPTDSSVVLATGRLTARHSETGLVASVTQQSPVPGRGTLTVNSLTSTTGAGSLDYVVEGRESGTVTFTTEPIQPNWFKVQLQGPVPPVLFTRGD